MPATRRTGSVHVSVHGPGFPENACRRQGCITLPALTLAARGETLGNHVLTAAPFGCFALVVEKIK